MAKPTFSMRLLVDTSGGKKRVLYAEADKKCVDFLFQILSLPIATVVGLLKDEEIEGSLPNLYKSLENLDKDYLQPNIAKNNFLQPVAPVSSSSIPLLAINSPTKKFYSCTNNCAGSSYYSAVRYFSDDALAVCPQCKKNMTMELTFVPAVKAEGAGGGVVQGMVTYMVMDDLEVKPISIISSLTSIKKRKVKDISTLEENVVKVGMKEAVKLLKASLDSKTVLTDVFC